MAIDYKTERTNDLDKIKNSSHPRRVVVAGPGTGKSYLFGELIKKKKQEGKTNFLAITFIGKLGDALADDLCGLAKTTTLHGFTRGFVLQNFKGWNYYPKVHDLITEDLKAEGIQNFEIGDENYLKKSSYYKAVGDVDVVRYAIDICKKDSNKIPIFDLILVDEFQDFNALESEFVDLLAQKNEIVIVGDDDQALYAFKGSSPSFIREKYDLENSYFESHTLRFCSRCTEVVIKYFHALVEKFELNNTNETDPAKRRIQKEYICYAPDKEADSKENPKLHLIKNCPVGMMAYKIREELQGLAENQKVKDVLIIGEGRSCEALLKTVAQQLKRYGFGNVTYKNDSALLNLRQNTIDAYKFLAKDESSSLGWRILNNPTDGKEKAQHLKNTKTLTTLLDGAPSALENVKDSDINELENKIESWRSTERSQQNEELRKNALIYELRRSSTYLPRPLSNLDITVCNILNSKGLGADVIFLIGFDQGKFPSKVVPTNDEVYQMLVAITRVKKRIYFINTVNKGVSKFSECLSEEDWNTETINTTS